MCVLQPHGGMLPLGGHLLGQHIFARVGARGVLERQELFARLLQGRVHGGQGLQIPRGGFPSGDQSRHRLGGPMASVVRVCGCAVLGEFEAWCALPAAQMGSDGLVLAGARQMVVVRFAGEGCAHEPRGDGRGMASKAKGASGMDFGVGGLTALRDHRRERAHRLGGKPLEGRRAGGRVDAHSGDLVAPLVGVGLESSEVPAGASRPEVVPDRGDGALLHRPLFLGLGDVAGDGGALEGPQKGQKVLGEPPQGALPLQDRGAPVVMDKCFGGP